MDLAEVTEQLYAADPGEFVALRTAAVKQARAAKDRELATAVGALRRPTRSAWLVNRLAREDGTALGELLDLGRALAEAQRNAAGDQLRTLSAQRHAAVGALVRRAAELGAAADQPASEAVRSEVGQILTAALADPALAEVVRAGQVTQAVSYGGFGPDLLLGSTPSAAPPPPTSLEEKRATKQSPDERREAATAEAERAAAALEAARAERDEAAEAERDAREAVAAAEQAVAVARRELAEREGSYERARADLEAAGARLDAAGTSATEAEQAATRAAQALRKLR